MSEDQYYEWNAIDRTLTKDELHYARTLSSHMDVVTPNCAVVTYQWGDFKHDPAEVLLRCFDAGIHWASWGSRRLMFRFPKRSIDGVAIAAYEVDQCIRLWDRGEYYVLDIDIEEEEFGGWEDGPADLGTLAAMRQQIIEGDHRALYLAWLKAVEIGEAVFEDDDPPPVSPGLNELDDSLEAFASEFLQLDRWLLQAAAADSEPHRVVDEESLAGALERLTPEECQAYLLRVLKDEPQVGAELRKQLGKLSGGARARPRASRPAEELVEQGCRLEQEDQRRRAEEAEKQRLRELRELAGRENSVWREVEDLIEQKKAAAYEQAIARLQQLRDLSVHEDRLPAFLARIEAIRQRYSRLSSLIDRMDQAGLRETAPSEE